MDLNDKEMMELAAVGAVMEMIGVTTEEEGAAFDEAAVRLAGALISNGLATATGTVDGENDEAEVDLRKMAELSFAANKMAAFFKQELQKMIAKKAMSNLLTGLVDALTDDDAGDANPFTSRRAG